MPLPRLIALDPFRSKRPTPPFHLLKKRKKKKKKERELSKRGELERFAKKGREGEGEEMKGNKEKWGE